MRIVCIGDSVTFGLGVKKSQRWTNLLQEAMPEHEIINCGISGDTTSGMLARFQKDVLEKRPDVVFILGGGNDIMLSLSDATARLNMATMAWQSFYRGVKVIIGLPVPIYREGISSEWKLYADRDDVEKIMSDYCEWLRVFCHNFKFPCVDFPAEFKVIKSNFEDFYLDGLHLNDSGNSFVAGILESFIRKISYDRDGFYV